MSLGASRLLLHLAETPLSSPVDGARAQAALFLLFLSFVIGQAMTFYGLLLSERVVQLPAVSKALAEKLSAISPALFFLSLAIQAPPLLVITDGAVLLLGLELVGNGGAVIGGPREEEPAGDVPQADGGAVVGGSRAEDPAGDVPQTDGGAVVGGPRAEEPAGDVPQTDVDLQIADVGSPEQRSSP
ncbi:hypothetical protein Taro_048935 [Colocasia esculenta]|uniref:Uncharacterized protein n=1 Tax=Colocasia esculenta TaxID=4460 RepID=A0A843X9J4_COLES|nr:hypothetical protein [Colocasia esculenta]